MYCREEQEALFQSLKIDDRILYQNATRPEDGKILEISKRGAIKVQPCGFGYITRWIWKNEVIERLD